MQDDDKLYFVGWYHETSELRFYMLGENDLYDNVKPFQFSEGLELIVNPGKDFYENYYTFSRTNDGIVEVTLSAVGLRNKSRQPLITTNRK